MSHEQNEGGFSNFSRLGKDCPRCGEENDKCGMLEDVGFVMCRTDTGDGIDPKLDKNGWEYWPLVVGEGDRYHETYSSMLNYIELSKEDQESLESRGISQKTIDENGYRTTPSRNKNGGFRDVISTLDDSYELENVPGFYLKDGVREANTQSGQTIIPVRNYSGRITQLVLRNNGKVAKGKSKYLMFSSDKKEDGTKVNPSIHFPLGASECTHEVRVTEGILKADIATALGDVYCIGLHGLTSFGLISAIEMLGVSKVRLCLDNDWHQNKNVLNGLRRIYTAVLNAGFEVVIEEWNENSGKGIDDVLKNQGKIWSLAEEDIEVMVECPRFNREDWAYINRTSQFAKLDICPIKIFDEKHFNNHFVKFKDEFAKEAKVHVRQCDSITYIPKGSRFELNDDFYDLNLWKNSGVEPRNYGVSLDFFFDHLNYLFPNDEAQQNMLLDWMANVVQHRGKKFSYALLLHGEEGTGKTWVVHCLSLIIGKSNVGKITNEYMKGQFNGMFEAKELLIINEIMAGGKLDFMNKMKDYIDCDEITINKKSVQEYQQKFMTNWFMSTNYDDALYVDDKDRRYNILSSPAVCGGEAEAEKRGGRLFRWSGGGKEQFPINEENLATLHRFLLDRKVTYSPFAKAPLTNAKKYMQDESLSVFEKFVKERIDEEMWPFNTDLICLEHIKMFPAIEKRFEKISPHKWGKTLKRFGAISYGSKIDENGKLIEEGATKIRMQSEGKKQRRIWILRKHSMYTELSAAKIEELYIKKKPATIEPEHIPSTGEEEPI